MVDTYTAITAATLGVAVLGMLGFAAFLAIGCVRGIKDEQRTQQD